MDGKTILIVDDDENLSQMVKISLSVKGALVYSASDGLEGLRQFYSRQPDIVLLDIRMPEMDGWEVCRQIRLLADTPIIMLTTMNDDDSILRGLEAGADDFITKPFNMNILVARVEAVLRRLGRESSPTFQGQYSDGYLTIDLERKRVFVQNEPIKLTATEFHLLAYLFENAELVLSYQQILQNVWGWEYQDSTDYVHVYVSNLRRKIEKDSRNPLYLLTEYGLGYRFEKQK